MEPVHKRVITPIPIGNGMFVNEIIRYHKRPVRVHVRRWRLKQPRATVPKLATNCRHACQSESNDE